MKPRTLLLTYFLSAFAIAWTGVLLVASHTGLPAPRGTPEVNRYWAFLAMLAGPTSASLSLTVLSGGAGGLRELISGLGRWRVAAHWYAPLLIAPGLLILTLAALAVVSPSYLPAIATSASPATVIAVAVVAGFGAGFFEELGWTGFATPRLLARYTWPRAGLLLGIIWAAWHALSDYWGGVAYGRFWAIHMLEWFVALAAFRMLMTWVYTHARSLLLGVLLHASFTGSQLLLWPTTDPAEELLWYGVFACALWVVVAGVSLRQRFASCRASRRERMRPLPGDALVPQCMYTVTHAITIDAPPERVWPWMAQMGADRAGWYSWDFLDNAGRPSAREVLEEFQKLAPGAVLPAVPAAKDAFVVASLAPPHDIVLTVPGPGATVVSWEHLAEAIDAEHTRLIVRSRVAASWKDLAKRAGAPGRAPLLIERIYRLLARMPDGVLVFLAGAGHRIMEARHLRGIKRRAEAFAHG